MVELAAPCFWYNVAKGPGERKRRQRPRKLLVYSMRACPRFFPRPAAFGKTPVRAGAAARERVHGSLALGSRFYETHARRESIHIAQSLTIAVRRVTAARPAGDAHASGASNLLVRLP